ncbi:MAG: hypothetical protein IJ574_02290 [Bacilli bacterium]|nr:hypothetical protein [Bacilli bacterium]
MICTSSYEECQSNKNFTYSISGNRGKDVNYKGNCYPKLAPKLSFWKVWHENIGKISEEENNKYYINEYYKQVLAKLDPKDVYEELENSILLCYEDNTKFCHRHIVAAWFELLLEKKVPEIKVRDYNVEEVSKPEYIKKYLEEVIRRNKNMRGFNSLRALYLFEKSEKYEEKADAVEEKNGTYADYYRQMACFLRCDADMAEYKYNSLVNQKKLERVKK